MALSLRDVGYFVSIAEHGNLGRAAEALGLSQPGLSKSLRRLEKEVEAKLVRRTPRGVELTDADSALYAHVNRLRMSLTDVAQEVADFGQGRAGRLRVGCGAGLGEHFLAAACSKMLMDAPKVSMVLTVAPSAILMLALRRGDLDLVVSSMPHLSYTELTREQLYDDRMIVYASTRHPRARRRQLSVPQIAAERWALSASDGLT